MHDEQIYDLADDAARDDDRLAGLDGVGDAA
jgi:hypothetical protein